MFYLELLEAAEAEKTGAKAVLKYVNFDTNLLDGIMELSIEAACDMRICSQDGLCKVSQIVTRIEAREERIQDVARQGYDYEKQLECYEDEVLFADIPYIVDSDKDGYLVIDLETVEISQAVRETIEGLSFRLPFHTRIPKEVLCVSRDFLETAESLCMELEEAEQDLHILSSRFDADDLLLIDESVFAVADK